MLVISREISLSTVEGLRLAGDAGVEAGVLDGDRHARGDELEQALMFVGEVAGGLGLDIEDADDPVLDDERNGELGADVGVGVDVVARPSVTSSTRRDSTLECGLADDAASQS